MLLMRRACSSLIALCLSICAFKNLCKNDTLGFPFSARLKVFFRGSYGLFAYMSQKNCHNMFFSSFGLKLCCLQFNYDSVMAWQHDSCYPPWQGSGSDAIFLTVNLRSSLRWIYRCSPGFRIVTTWWFQSFISRPQVQGTPLACGCLVGPLGDVSLAPVGKGF